MKKFFFSIEPDTSYFPKVVSLKILFLFELVLLTLVVFEYYKISLALTFAFLSFFLIYWFFNKPFILLNLFLFTILVSAIDSFNFGKPPSQISLVDIFFPILFVIFLLRILIDEKINLHTEYKVIIIIFLLFLIWTFFTAMISINKSVSLAYWRNYFSGFIIFTFTTYILEKTGKTRAFIVSLILWGFILALIEFYILYTLGGINVGLVRLFLRKNLLAISWGRSNYLATFYVLLIPITIGYFFTLNSKKLKIVFASILVVMIAAVMLTFSKGGILSLSIALLILISKALKKRTFIPVLLIVSIISIVVALNPMTRAMFEGVSKVESSFSYMSRLNFYEDAWKIFLENPITGVGFGNLGSFSMFKFTKAVASAHNIVLGMLGETGLVGTMLFISLIIYSLTVCFKNYIKETNEKNKILLWSFISAFFGVIVNSMIEPNFEGWQFSIIFWASIAVFLSVGNLSSDEKPPLLSS